MVPVQTQTVARSKFQPGTKKLSILLSLSFCVFLLVRSGSLLVSCFTSTTINDGEPEVRHSQKPLSTPRLQIDTSNYLASKLTSDNHIQRLREIRAQLQTIAAKFEEIFGQMSAFLTLNDLVPFLQKSADFSLFLLHYANKIDNLTQNGQVALHQRVLPSSADAKIHLQHPLFQPPNSSTVLQPHPTTRDPCGILSAPGNL